MKLNCQAATRLTLVEYGAPNCVVPELATSLGAARGVIRDQLIGAGERVARALGLSVNPVSVSDPAVRVTDVAGIVRVGPRLELEVAPKFLGTDWSRWREDFFFVAMLSRHGRLLANDRIGSSIGGLDDLATLVARAMITMYWAQHRRPLRTYRFTRVEDFVLDGEVDPESIVMPPAEGYAQLLMTYERCNVFNAAIAAATRALLPLLRDPDTRRQLLRVASMLAPQRELRRIQHRRLPNRALHWQALHDLAVDVLRGGGVAYASGPISAPGFVLDTWRVWEDLVAIGLRLGCGAARVHTKRAIALGKRVTTDSSGRLLTRTAWVTPDVALEVGPGLLVDAKYKGRIQDTKNRIAESDLYEALAFATASKIKRVVLVYPAVAEQGIPRPIGAGEEFERVTIEGIEVSGIDVEVRGISQRGALRQFGDRLAARVGGIAASIGVSGVT